MFFATVQNLLIFAVTQKTPPNSSPPANPADPHFGLLAWKGDKVRKTDIVVAKNYLTEDDRQPEPAGGHLPETAELRAKSKQETHGLLETERGSDHHVNGFRCSRTRVHQPRADGGAPGPVRPVRPGPQREAM